MAVAVAPAEVGFSASEVGLLFLFLFLLAAIYVLDTTRAPIVGIAGAVPLVGSGLGRAVDSAFGSVRGWLYANLSQSLRAYATLLSWLQTLWASLWSTAEGLATLTVVAVLRIKDVIIPAEIAAAESWAGQQVGAARAYAASLEVQAINHADALVAAEASHAAALVGQAEAQALNLFQTAEADAAALVAHASGVAAALIAQERAFTLQTALGLEAEIQAAFVKAEAISAAAEAALRGDLGTVEQQLLGQLRSGVSSLEQEIAKAQAAIGTGALGLAAVAADVAALKALECLKYCSTLAGLGQALQGLDVALIFGLYAAYEKDPAGTDRFLQSTVAPGLSGLVAQARSILGP